MDDSDMMQSLTYLGAGELDWQTVEVPRPTPGAVVARPLAVARCDLDAMMVTNNLFPGPYSVGHEFAAEIVQVGPGVARWKPGDRVIAPFQISCGGCGPCGSDRFAACEQHRSPAGSAFGFGPAGGDHGGAMSERILIPHADHLLVPLPLSVDPIACAALGDNVIDGYRSVAGPLAVAPGADVLIIGGAGDSIGYYTLLWAKLLGASKVRYGDTSDTRCSIASNLGAEVQLIDEAWPRRIQRSPITIAFTTDTTAMITAIRSTDDYGHCTIPVPHFGVETALPLLEMYTKGITIHTSRADARRYLNDVVDHVVERRFDPLAIPTNIVGWQDARDHWLTAGEKLLIAV